MCSVSALAHHKSAWLVCDKLLLVDLENINNTPACAPTFRGITASSGGLPKAWSKLFLSHTSCKGEKCLLGLGRGSAAPGYCSPGTGALQELPQRETTGPGVPLLCEASVHSPEVLLHLPVSHSPTAHRSMATRGFTGKNFNLNVCFFTKCINGILWLQNG